MPDKTLGVWLTNPVPGLFRWLAQLWPGWRIEQWDDRYEEHLLRCGPSITATELDIYSGVLEADSWLLKRVFQSHPDSPVGRVRSLGTLFGVPEPGRTVSSATAAQAAELPNAQEWARFERACAQVRAGRRAA